MVASGPLADGMVVRTYNAASHKRFDPFPTNPQINTNHIFSAVDLTGVGFKSTNLPTVQCTLVGRKHILFATHFRANIDGETLTFVNAANQVFTRTCTTQTIIHKDGNQSDLVLVELDTPIDSDTGITPLPYYATAPVVGVTPLGVIGRKNAAPDSGNPMVGEATYDVGLALADIGGGIETVVYQFDYLTAGLGANDCFLQSGDSGSPTFVNVGGTAALIGIHSAINVIPSGQENFDTFVPHYTAELDAVLNPLGFRMRPHNAPATTMSGSGAVSQTTPRKAMALDYDFTVENTGTELAGNVEIELVFASGEGPDSVSGTGWVAYGSGDRWTLRRSSLGASAQGSITASWAAAPSPNADALAALADELAPTAEASNPLAVALSPAARLEAPVALASEPNADALAAAVELLAPTAVDSSPLVVAPSPAARLESPVALESEPMAVEAVLLAVASSPTAVESAALAAD